ncbi:MAG: hypothetical protein COV29_00410 [Candidatus Yanofskybacteria bacterium CG10_big_fil_rev_8_21_14_0_10_36_16]|uniref:Phosphoribosyltransferase domain-containing protein n=1 Tax=Candidatus Yanofskybacteria bacterium CG10_big_fil_rev_8_21_14_0_10_36_16 TaxID=1975096 RepID=A0A2J0Q8Z9_9BACT|nr:MAG: hypothetical protein COV29_00410 [Candidatus Yanofskybacteria bacterium CG10_big_fil_rev_8_21_14_0_10_36_16]
MAIHKQAMSWVLDMLFPQHCVGCEDLVRNKDFRYFCKECLKKIKTKDDFVCVFCDTKSTDGSTCPFCSKKYHLDQLLPATSYENIIRKAIKEMKYRYIKDIITDLSGLFLEFLNKQARKGKLDFNNNEVVVPVPMQTRRENNRGFNQAELLAQIVGHNFGLKVSPMVLKRRFSFFSKHQADIKIKKERLENAENVYECTTPPFVAGRTVWLVDDVSTTGATLNDCARALKEAGAKKVVGIVLAKGKLNKRPESIIKN